jgi:hypothetical protein
MAAMVNPNVNTMSAASFVRISPAIGYSFIHPAMPELNGRS